MANMGYCRWQNTASDLEDCAEHITDKLGKDEARARARLLETAASMLCELGMEVDIDELGTRLAEIQAQPNEDDES